MADTSVLRINDIEVGTVLRLLLPGTEPAELAKVPHGGEAQSLPKGVWQHLQGFNWRSLLGRVLVNDSVTKTITLEVQEPRATQQRFRVVVPYASVRRAARLVQGARTFIDDAAEQAYLRKHRQRGLNNKAFFHTHDQFIGVQVVALIAEEPVIINFTWQVPIDGTSWVVSLPADALADGNYTVVGTVNTLTGANALLSIPEAGRTAAEFTLNTATQLDAGTTIDFHVQAR